MNVGAVFAASVVIALGAAAAYHVWRRPMRRGAKKLAPSSARLPHNVSRGAARRAVSAPVRLSDLTSAGQESHRQREEQEDLAALALFLDDVRDLYAADEAIFWEWMEQRDALVPVAWSSADAERPKHFLSAQWAPLVQWAAEGRVVHFDT